MDLSRAFWESSVEDLSRGYIFDPPSKRYVCLLCGAVFESGIVYPMGDVLYEAGRAAAAHVSSAHGDLFEYLLEVAREYAGVTELQSQLLRHFHKGANDAATARALGQGSTSTVRNHRFKLREREKQAKVFLALMQTLGKSPGVNEGEELVGIHRRAKMVDERYVVTEAERQQIINKYFEDGGSGPMNTWPSREKRKLIALQHIATRFEAGRQYTEKEINETLKSVFHDYVTLRRYLIEYGFLDRKRDGSVYWVRL